MRNPACSGSSKPRWSFPSRWLSYSPSPASVVASTGWRRRYAAVELVAKLYRRKRLLRRYWFRRLLSLHLGQNEYSFWERIGSSFQVSLFYICFGSLIGMTVGLLIGVYFALSKAEWPKRIVELFGALPDFVLILLLQFVVVFIASKTGLVVFQVASLSTDDPAIALPLFSAALIPANYMIRNVAVQMRLTLSEDYIGFAKARGLGRMRIVFLHALPNVLPFFKADLHKLLGILMGNMFVLEYLYNLNGVGMFLFSDAISFDGYQYALVVNGLMTLIILYALVYGLLRLYLWGWEKVISR